MIKINEQIEAAYGSNKENWGDRSIFQGDYINFGYWQNISLNQKLTTETRVESSATLYKHVIDTLNVSRSDTVLELGCGRAVGMLDAFEYVDMEKMIGIDITRTQIERAKIKKNELEKQNLREKLEIERIKYNLDSLKKQWELALSAIEYEKEEFEQELKILSQKIDKFEKNPESKTLKQQLESSHSSLRKETELDIFKQEWTTGIQENKKRIDKEIERKNEIARKIDSTELLVASADSTGLDDNNINKIYSVEVFQHIEDFDTLANEAKRILAPEGIFSFCAHLSTNHSSYNKLRQENLLIDEIEILAPVDEVVNAFKESGFDVNHYSIGEHVFEGYEQWTTQIHSSATASHNIYDSYKSGYIDYYVFVMNQINEDRNIGVCLNDRDEL